MASFYTYSRFYSFLYIYYQIFGYFEHYYRIWILSSAVTFNSLRNVRFLHCCVVRSWIIIDCCVNVVRLLFNSSPLITAIISFLPGPPKKQTPSKFCKWNWSPICYTGLKTSWSSKYVIVIVIVSDPHDHSLPSKQSTTSYFESNNKHVVTNNLMCYNHPFFVPNDHFRSVLGGSVWNEIGISANSAN